MSYGNVIRLKRKTSWVNIDDAYTLCPAHFGGEPPWKHQIKSNKYKVTTAYYTDKNTASRHNSMTPRLKAKIPKMLEWQVVNADWYVWMDSSIRLKDIDLEAILKCAGNNPLCFFRHTSERLSLKKERGFCIS